MCLQGGVVGVTAGMASGDVQGAKFTCLFMTSEDDKAASAWLAAVRLAQRPECDWPTTILREPALEFALSGVMWQAAKVQHLRFLGQERPYVAPSIEWASKYFWITMLIRLRWSCLLRQRPYASCEGESLLQGTPWRRWSQCLKVEWQVCCDLAR